MLRVTIASPTPTATRTIDPPMSRATGSDTSNTAFTVPPMNGARRKASTVPRISPTRSIASRTNPRHQPRTSNRASMRMATTSMIIRRRARCAFACCPCPCSRSWSPGPVQPRWCWRHGCPHLPACRWCRSRSRGSDRRPRG